MITVTHPNIKSSFVMRKHKFDYFIKMKVWKEEGIDTKEFIITNTIIGDAELMLVFEKEFPEEKL